MVGFKWRTLVGRELQVENYSGWLPMKNGVVFSRRTTVVSFRWRTTALGYIRRTTVVCFKWRTLALLLVNNYSAWLQMENDGGYPKRTAVVGLRWKLSLAYRRGTTVVGFK